MKLMLAVIVLLAAAPLYAQSKPSVSAAGHCTIANQGSDNIITIKNCGLGAEQAKEIVGILNKILKNQINPVAVDRKLNEIIASMRKADVNQQSTITQKNSGGCNQQVVGGNNNTNNCNESPVVTASAQIQRRNANAAIPWETLFTIHTTSLTETGDLHLNCSGPVIRAGISRINPDSFISGSNGPDPNKPDTVIYQLGPEMLSPGRAVTIAVYSMQPVKVISGSIGPNQIHFPRE